MSAPVVSVVMSVFNGERFLRLAIDSILAQTYRDFEFIVIDDGSQDGTAAILEEYHRRDSRIQVVRQENRGLVESLNRGCALARGIYIARMDADDIAMERRLEQQVAFLNEHPRVGLLGGAVDVIDLAGKTLRTTANPSEDAAIRAVLPHDCPFWHPTVTMRKEALSAAGGYRKLVVHAEDYDLWLRMAEVCEMANLETVLTAYRLHSNQVTTRNCRQMIRSGLAARAAAARRAQRLPDPLDSAASITDALLAELGIAEAEVECALAARFVYVIRNMLRTGEFEEAANLAGEMRAASQWKHAGRRTMADFHLLAAGLYWKQGRIAASLSSVAEAVAARPVVLGRSFLPFVERLRGHAVESGVR